MNFFDILLAKKEAGGGDAAVLKQKTVTQNGTYNASSDNADGYSKVTVNVPASAVDTGTKSITANGTGIDVVGYAAVDVNVPNSYAAADEGKVVSNGALVAQTSDTVTTNDTYDTTLINSLTVNVSGGVSISDGVVVKTRDANGYPTDIDYYGQLYPYSIGVARNDVDYYFGKLENITFKSTITSIPANAFASACRRGNGLGALTFPDVVSVGNSAFGGSNSNGIKCTSLTLPSLETTGNTQGVFSSNMLGEIYLPKLTTVAQNNNSYGIFRGANTMTYCQIGSVGYAAPDNIKIQFRDCTQSTLTICIYCLGSQVDSILSGLRDTYGATNATVVFKASESTTYNNVSYSAGDTILTSTPA